MVSALVLLVLAGRTTWGMIGDLSQAPVLELLDVLVVLLGCTAWLLRRKEREPDEGDAPAPA